jgi:hypothetical protein
VQLGHPSERPQHDAVDGYAPSARNEGVGKLVTEDARQVQGGRDDRCHPVDAGRESRCHIAKLGGREGEGDERPDEDHAPVQAHPGSTDRAEVKVLLHATSLCRIIVKLL